MGATRGARGTASSPPLTSRIDPRSDWSGLASRFEIEIASAVPFQLIHFQAGASWLGQGIHRVSLLYTDSPVRLPTAFFMIRLRFCKCCKLCPFRHQLRILSERVVRLVYSDQGASGLPGPCLLRGGRDVWSQHPC